MTKYQKAKLVLATIFFCSFLYFLNIYKDKGRYVIEKWEYPVILDTHTGRAYLFLRKKYMDIEDYERMKFKEEDTE